MGRRPLSRGGVLLLSPSRFPACRLLSRLPAYGKLNESPASRAMSFWSLESSVASGFSKFEM